LKWYNFNIGERGDLKKENLEHHLGFVLRKAKWFRFEFKPVKL
jgi:hypothetical protein